MSPAEVDDVLQETFLSAWQAADRFDPTRDAGPWLTAIARNRAIDRLRRHASRPQTSGSDEVLAVLPSQEPDPAESLEQEWGQAVQAVSELPDVQRRYITLHHLDGFSLDEIAEGDGTTVDSVKAHLYRARRSLRCTLQHLASWPALGFSWLRRVIATSRTDPTSAATGGTMMAAAALTGFLVTFPILPPADEVEEVPDFDQSHPEDAPGFGYTSPTPSPARSDSSSTITTDSARELSHQGEPTRRPVAHIDHHIPNPTSGEQDRHRIRIWLEDDGNDSVILSSAETARRTVCAVEPSRCPEPPQSVGV